MSKPEIHQYMSKVYQLPIQKTNTFNKQGRIKRDQTNGKKWRKNNWKKATLTLDYEVDSDYKNFNL